ncbi:MAG: hypothetical protein Q8J64_02505 [Thermodesulfovibrionales bacterium]|nr:hypothetical protein [Thermodesulfovibrionales bacterium]
MHLKKKILVVEDADILRRILRDFLWLYGHDAVCVKSAEEAMEELKNMDYNLIIIGYPHPWKVGPEEGDSSGFIASVREIIPDIPVIRLNSCEGLQSPAQGIEVIGRPLDLKGLMDVVGVVFNIPKPHP